MDPVEAWVDQKEVQRLVKSLGDEVEVLEVESAEGAYGRDFVGFEASQQSMTVTANEVEGAMFTESAFADPLVVPQSEAVIEKPPKVTPFTAVEAKVVEKPLAEEEEDKKVEPFSEVVSGPSMMGPLQGTERYGHPFPSEASSKSNPLGEASTVIAEEADEISTKESSIPNPFLDHQLEEEIQEKDQEEREWEEWNKKDELEQEDPFKRVEKKRDFKKWGEGSEPVEQIEEIEEIESSDDDWLDLLEKGEIKAKAPVECAEEDPIPPVSVTSPFQEASEQIPLKGVPVASFATEEQGEPKLPEIPASSSTPSETAASSESIVAAEEDKTTTDKIPEADQLLEEKKAAAAPSFLDRLNSFGSWVKEYTGAEKYFVFDREGKILVDEVGSENLLKIAKTLSNAVMASQRRGGETVRSGAHMKVSADSFLEVIPTKSKYGALVFGGILPKGLEQDQAEQVANRLSQAAESQ